MQLRESTNCMVDKKDTNPPHAVSGSQSKSWKWKERAGQADQQADPSLNLHCIACDAIRSFRLLKPSIPRYLPHVCSTNMTS